MKWNSVYALDFQAPALMGEQLTYLRGRQFMGHLVVRCFLPYAGLLSVEAMDRHAARFLEIDATLLIVSSGGRPLHRLWIDESPPLDTRVGRPLRAASSIGSVMVACAEG